MIPLSSSPVNPPTVEQGVNALVGDVKRKVGHTYEEWEQRVRHSPGKAILVAVGAGYCLHRLPLRSLLVTQVRLLAALAPPTLLAFGAAKLCEFLQRQAQENSREMPKARRADSLGSFE